MRARVRKTIEKVRSGWRRQAAIREHRAAHAPLPATGDLLDFIPATSPHLTRPDHLAPIAEVLTKAFDRQEALELAFHAPVRHGKTELVKHAIVWALLRNPTLQIMYVAYNQDRADEVSADVRQLARQAGLVLRQDAKAVRRWKLPQGGAFFAAGISGTVTGRGADILIVDDPIKDRLEAESANRREKVWTWLEGTAFNRLEPGASVIFVMARWHDDDPTGRAIAQLSWPYVCLPAINAAGEPLWPQRWPVEELQKKKTREGDYNWASLYQGEPRPAEGMLFRDARYTTVIPQPTPDTRVKIAIGIDVSKTAKQTSDYSAIVVMARVDQRASPVQEKRTFYVILDAYEKQIRPTCTRDALGNIEQDGLTMHIRSRMARWDTQDVGLHANNNEMPIVRTIRDLPQDEKVPLRAFTLKGNKLMRAQKYAAAWNAGDVYLLRSSATKAWTRPLVLEHVGFTGAENEKDNLVDAATTAFEMLSRGHSGGSVGSPRTTVSRRMR